MPPCKHYWLLAIPKGHLRWVGKHTVARCRHCPAWTVVEYGMPPGPCSHVVGLTSARDLARELTAQLAGATMGEEVDDATEKQEAGEVDAGGV